MSYFRKIDGIFSKFNSLGYNQIYLKKQFKVKSKILVDKCVYMSEGFVSPGVEPERGKKPSDMQYKHIHLLKS